MIAVGALRACTTSSQPTYNKLPWYSMQPLHYKNGSLQIC